MNIMRIILGVIMLYVYIFKYCKLYCLVSIRYFHVAAKDQSENGFIQIFKKFLQIDITFNLKSFKM